MEEVRENKKFHKIKVRSIIKFDNSKIIALSKKFDNSGEQMFGVKRVVENGANKCLGCRKVRHRIELSLKWKTTI